MEKANSRGDSLKRVRGIMKTVRSLYKRFLETQERGVQKMGSSWNFPNAVLWLK
jgi:hypothetical protein